MKQVEFRPNIFNPQLVGLIIASPIIFGLVSIIVVNNIMPPLHFLGNMPTIYKIVTLDIIVSSVSIILLVGASLLDHLLNKIILNDNSLIFETKTNKFTLKPTISKFNINEIETITFKWKFSKSSGKPTLSSYLNWFYVKKKNTQENEISLHNWDQATLKKILYTIHQQYPRIDIQPSYIKTQPWKGELEEFKQKK
jgi:hypothetical protein